MTLSRIALEGLPHSEISGSKPVCGSPELIAAYHVLHRRPAPRHPPYALSSLTTTFTLLETTESIMRSMPCILYWIFGCQGAQASALVAAPPVPPLPLQTEAGAPPARPPPLAGPA